jgi:hypothetical protein
LFTDAILWSIVGNSSDGFTFGSLNTNTGQQKILSRFPGTFVFPNPESSLLVQGKGSFNVGRRRCVDARD